jgi:mono/diheme cytochrome c family protein
MLGLRLLLIVFALLSLPGCGDDAGDAGGDGAGRFAPSTAPAFQVVSTQPAADQQDVPRNAAIVLRFSDLPDPATLSYPWVAIGPRSDPVPVIVEISLVDREVRFQPQRPLIGHTEIVVSVSRRARSLSGRALGTTFRTVFRTGAGLLPALPEPAPPRLAQLAAPDGVLGQTCARSGCHRRDGSGAPAAGLDLAQDPIALRQHLLMGRRGGLDALLWVEVGRPESSYLLRKLLAAQPGTFARITGSPMPLVQPALSTEALRTIETWIRKGAL